MNKTIVLILALCCAGISSAQTEPIPTPQPPVPESEHFRIVDPNKPTPVVDIVDFPDVEAEFPGGIEAMKEYIQTNIDYPKESVENGDQGRVYLVFIVEMDGSLSAIEVMRAGLTDALNKEAIRLVQNMPKWKPGEVNGKPIRTRIRLPITFTLTTEDK